MSEKQPQQNDHRDWHAQQPQQNSSSHPRLLQISHCRKNAGETVPFLCRHRNFSEQRTFSGFGNIGKRKANSKQQVAVSIDRPSHFRIDVAGLAAAGQPPSCSGRPAGNGTFAFTTSR
jgi:hypothetical protein